MSNTTGVLNLILSTSVKSTPDVYNNNSISYIGGNVSAEERQLFLQQLQASTTKTMIPAVIFLTILGVTGFIGNSLVIFVYTQKFQKSATRLLIITIAVFDLVANVLAIPGDIYDMFHYWDFDNQQFCRSRMFFSAFTTLSSAMALLAVAIIRYRKVCKHQSWQITFRNAKFISIAVACLGILFSAPYAILNGRQTKMTPRPDIFGYECTTDDNFVDTIWPLVNYGFFLILYIFCCGPFTVLYILIGVKAWKHSKIHGGSAASSSTTKTTIRNMSSSIIDRSTECQPGATSDVSDSIQVMEERREAASSECNSIDPEDIAMNEFSPLGEVAMKKFISLGEGKEDVEQYTVRILKDRIEIRTPIMGELIINLQTAMPDLADLEDQTDVFEDETRNQTELSHDGYQVPDTDADQFVQLQENPSDDRNIVVQDGIDHSKQGGLMEYLNTLFSTENNAITENSSNEHTENSSNEHTENSSNEHTENSSNETAFIQSGLLETALKVEESIEDMNETRTRSKKFNHDMVTAQSKSSCSSRGSRDVDPISSLKWVDITYSNQGPLSVPVPGTSKTDGMVSFRISASNNLLQKTEWLRNIIAEALGKNISKAKTEDEVSEPKSHHKTESESESSKNKNIADEDVNCRENNVLGNASSRRTGTTSVRKRLKELVTKGNSILKIGSKTGRRPISRTTTMLIIISAVYSLGFVPHLGLMFFKFTSPEKYWAMTMAEQAVYNLFLRTFFLNCAVNPIIYSLCDINFRRECLSLLKCFSRKRFS